PEQPPPWTKTRSPASVLFSSASSSLILVAADGVTLIISTVLPRLIIHWRRGLSSYWTHLAPRRLRLDPRPGRGGGPIDLDPPGMARRADRDARRPGPCRS